jgi:prepilin-type N-terminal cleavage/methylation domain-containing protein
MNGASSGTPNAVRCGGRGAGAAGFTLLEVVIAMTVLALVAGICYAAFHLGVRAVERGEVAVVTAQRLRVATDVMIRQVKSTVAQPALVEEDSFPYFVGTPTSMSFVTSAGQLSGGGRARVTYRFDRDPPRLTLEETPHFTADSLGSNTPEAEEARSTVLLDGFTALDFCYLYDDGSETEWKCSWDSFTEEVLPAAVRIVIHGLPGIEEDTWGQEIPVMAGAFGETGLELQDNDVADCEQNAGSTNTGANGNQTLPGQSHIGGPGDPNRPHAGPDEDPGDERDDD